MACFSVKLYALIKKFSKLCSDFFTLYVHNLILWFVFYCLISVTFVCASWCTAATPMLRSLQ